MISICTENNNALFFYSGQPCVTYSKPTTFIKGKQMFLIVLEMLLDMLWVSPFVQWDPAAIVI